MTVSYELDLLHRFSHAKLTAAAVGLRLIAGPEHLLLQDDQLAKGYAKCRSLDEAMAAIHHRREELARGHRECHVVWTPLAVPAQTLAVHPARLRPPD
jgi:hypothetical protein